MSGDVELNRVISQNVNINTMSGSISVGVNATTLHCKTMSGNISINHALTGNGSATLTTTAGNVYYHPIGVRTLYLTAPTSGTYDRDPNGYDANVVITTMSGGVTVC